MTKTFKKSQKSKLGLYPEYLIKEVDRCLKSFLKRYEGIPEELRNSIRYSIESSGKRFRPVLSLATAQSLGFEISHVMPTACAIEFIHTYSLIHDDLPAIDNDDLRRGKPTCHRQFGEDIAILTGDALFAESFNIILKDQIADPDIKLRVLDELISASGASGMVAGQIVDVCSTGSIIPKERLEYMHLNKTAKLITAAVRSSAILCNAGPQILKGLTEYGLNIGLAFQITDDILDITSNSVLTGKTHGKDILQLKSTYPHLWGLEESKKIAERKISKAINSIKNINIDNRLLVDIARFILTRKA